MFEFIVLCAVAITILWHQDQKKQATLMEMDRAGIMMNAALDDLAALNDVGRTKAHDCFSAMIEQLAVQFPGDPSTLAVLHRYTYNSSDQKLDEVVRQGRSSHAVALYRGPSLIVATAMSAVAQAELNLRKHKFGSKYRRIAEDLSRDVRDHFVIASSRTVGDAAKEIGLKRLARYSNQLNA